MPKIELKPNSPEYNDSKNRFESKFKARCCEMPGCSEKGEYRAPRDRNLSTYYWFCLEHVQEYNKAWNFFSGMSMHDIEDYIYNSNIWDRPTQRFDTMANTEAIKRKAWQTYNFTEKEPPRDKTFHYQGGLSRNTPELEALAIMGLEPPVNIEKIKERYRALAKKYHPDLNRDDSEAEELLKRINMAYTLLKLSYQKFETLPERT